MSKHPIVSKISLFILILLCQLLPGQESSKSLFNDNWQFHQGDLQIEHAESNDINWEKVTLPHDWSIQSPFSKEWASGTGFLPGGIGWYKKVFDITDYDENKQYAIYFDGVYKNSEVWINGHYLGKRPNGSIPFQYDLTPFLKASGNLILIKADHSDFADNRYYTGSGIYRNVYFLSQNPVHFSQWGVFFSTPEITEDKAEARIQLSIENHTSNEVNSTIRTTITDTHGNIVAEDSTILNLWPGRENFTEIDLRIPNPLLWSPKDPDLYKLSVKILRDNKREVAVWEDMVGVRNFRFDADKGFFLNGENMLIKGVCIHHDAGALGAAVPEEVWRERFKTIKELGANAIRMSHYPHQDYIYDLADEMGFLVQDEAFDEWEFGKNKWIEGWNVGTPGKDGSHKDFRTWGEKDVEDMVRRNRNHPSIIMWSIGNEIDYPNDPYSHPVLDEGRNPQIYGKGYQPNHPPAVQLGKLANELAMSVKKYDTTRPVTAALAGVTMSNFTAYPDILDVVGYNYQEFRYKEDHEKYPDRVIYGSENGDELSAWKAVTDNDFIASQFLWTAFDFIGEAGKWPYRSSGAGIIDLAGKPKPDFYFRKSLWNENPMVYIGITDTKENVSRRRNISSSWQGEPGELKYVSCYTNTEQVELFLNNKSLGKKDGNYTEEMIAWEVPFKKGTLSIKGYDKDGKTIASYAIRTPDKIAGLQLTTDKKTFSPHDRETIILDITLQDKNGTTVVNDDRDIRINIDGPAQILGLESGDLTSHEDYQADHRKSFKGQLRAYVQTLPGKDENIKLEVESEGLRSKKIIIRSE